MGVAEAGGAPPIGSFVVMVRVSTVRIGWGALAAGFRSIGITGAGALSGLLRGEEGKLTGAFAGGFASANGRVGTAGAWLAAG
jgi:hypothetical protein